MTRAITSFFAAFLFLTYATVGLAQSDDELELAATFKRVANTLRMVNRESNQAGSDLELIGEQKEQLKQLRREYESIVREFAALDESDQESKAAFVVLKDRFSKLETELNTSILLPHQSQLLQVKVFNQAVAQQGGNLLKTLAQNYSHEFEFDKEQKKQIATLEKSVAEKLAAAKARYEKEVKAIATKAREDVKKVLTPSQLEILEKYQDKHAESQSGR